MRTYQPDYIPKPGDTLREVLVEARISQSELASRMGRPKKTISEIVSGKAAITTDTALQLEMVLGISAEFWTVREQQYRDFVARVEHTRKLSKLYDWAREFPVGRMVKLGMMPSSKNNTEKVRHLLRFFGVSAPEQWEELNSRVSVAFRRSSAFEADEKALGAWLRAGLVNSQKIELQSFDKLKFISALEECRALTNSSPDVFVRQIKESCSIAGVAVVFIPELPKSRVSGASRWISAENAMIQLSLRYKTNDHLWFTFFHEAAHILLHGKRQIFLDTTKHEGKEEDEANRWAASFLIPPSKFRRFVEENSFTKSRIKAFAKEIGIAPGIVVGRLQHDNQLEQKYCNDLKIRYEWVSN